MTADRLIAIPRTPLCLAMLATLGFMVAVFLEGIGYPVLRLELAPVFNYAQLLSTGAILIGMAIRNRAAPGLGGAYLLFVGLFVIYRRLSLHAGIDLTCVLTALSLFAGSISFLSIHRFARRPEEAPALENDARNPPK